MLSGIPLLIVPFVAYNLGLAWSFGVPEVATVGSHAVSLTMMSSAFSLTVGDLLSWSRCRFFSSRPQGHPHHQCLDLLDYSVETPSCTRLSGRILLSRSPRRRTSGVLHTDVVT